MDQQLLDYLRAFALQLRREGPSRDHNLFSAAIASEPRKRKSAKNRTIDQERSHGR